MIEPDAEPQKVELHYTLRLQREAAGRKFVAFCESLAEEQGDSIRAEIQKVADERVAELAQQNTEYWQAMIDAETKLREIETLLSSLDERPASDLVDQIRAVLSPTEVVK